jgi:FAD/FMN-containing dehydrogenase
MGDELLRERPHLLIAPFGHEMLGALHFNVIWPKNHTLPMQPVDRRQIQEIIYDKVVNEFGGTFSAEHGIGPYNQWAYDKYTPENIKQESKNLKNKFDPKNILNPNFSYY